MHVCAVQLRPRLTKVARPMKVARSQVMCQWFGWSVCTPSSLTVMAQETLLQQDPVCLKVEQAPGNVAFRMMTVTVMVNDDR